MNDYHRKPSLAVSNEAQKQCSTTDRNLSYVFDDHRLEQSREPKKTEKSTYFTKYTYDWNGPKVSQSISCPWSSRLKLSRTLFITELLERNL